MADAAGADVPAHNEPNRDPADFAYTNKSLVCCYICRLVKSRNQVGRTVRGGGEYGSAPSENLQAQIEVGALCFLPLAPQFYEGGCDNCKNVIGPAFSYEDYTTPSFSG